MSDALRIAIVHYHLRPGGVTRIIGQTAAVLTPRGERVVVLAGAPPPGEWPVPAVPVRVVEGLNYAEGRGTDPRTLAARMMDAATAALGGAPDVWHVHNHSLGRNPGLTMAVRRLAESGAHLLLQIHDFPEDGRPANYRSLLRELGEGDFARLHAQLYPAAPQVHYAVLNQRDLGFMRTAGAANVHRLANPVTSPGVDAKASDMGASTTPDGRLFLYPTRALRRKNLGELLLWAVLAPPGDRFAATLAPTTAADLAVYEGWKELARALALPVAFEVGLQPGASYPGLVQSAHAILTTSVAEGFGLAFLEPWLAGRPLAGRNLPEITADFASAGVVLDGLYDRLPVPLEWVGRDRLTQAVTAGLTQGAAAFGRRLRAADVDQALAAAILGDCVDFGRLDEAGQAAVIRRLKADSAARGQVEPAGLGCGIDVARRRLAVNGAAVSAHFGLDAYGERLRDIYRALAAAAPGPVQALQGEALLDAFLAPERFCLLRT